MDESKRASRMAQVDDRTRDRDGNKIIFGRTYMYRDRPVHVGGLDYRSPGYVYGWDVNYERDGNFPASEMTLLEEN